MPNQVYGNAAYLGELSAPRNANSEVFGTGASVGANNDCTAFGAGANCSSSNGTAIGHNAKAGVNGCVAVGGHADAQTQEGTAPYAVQTAIGYSAAATGGESVAVGQQAQAREQGTVAVGRNANATGLRGTAVGRGALATATDTVAVGHTSQASAQRGTALGQSATATADAGTALGYYCGAQGANAVAVGSFQSVAADGVGVGNSSTVTANSVAIGSGAQAGYGSQGYATAVGRAALAYTTQSIAIGYLARVYSDAGSNGIAIGYNAELTTNSPNTIAIGTQCKPGSLTAQGIAIGYQVDLFGTNAVGIGTLAGARSGTVSVGGFSKATGTQSAAYGGEAEALGVESTAIGQDAECGVGGVRAVAVGRGSRAGNADCVAVGRSANVTRIESVGVGNSSYVTAGAGGGIALGYNAGVMADYGMALGYKAVVEALHTNSVAVGRQAVTTAANQMMVGSGTHQLNPYVHGSISTEVDGYGLVMRSSATAYDFTGIRWKRNDGSNRWSMGIDWMGDAGHNFWLYDNVNGTTPLWIEPGGPSFLSFGTTVGGFGYRDSTKILEWFANGSTWMTIDGNDGLVKFQKGVGAWNKTPPAVQPSKINDPSGGTTVDAEARTAINAIIDVLEGAGLSAST